MLLDMVPMQMSRLMSIHVLHRCIHRYVAMLLEYGANPSVIRWSLRTAGSNECWD